jgi:MFS family permease
MCNGLQFFTNIGWAFLVLTLGDYLKHVLHADDEAGGTMTTVALAIGIIGMPVGGWLTDYLSRRHGIRPGRMLPMSVSKFTAAGLYLMALTTRSPWVAAIWFGLATFFADLGLPALWTAMQDISGRYQAQLFAWSNMWGNFGAAIQPVLFTAVLESFDTNRDYHEGVWLCAAAFVIAGLFALGVDVEKPAVREAA